MNHNFADDMHAMHDMHAISNYTQGLNSIWTTTTKQGSEWKTSAEDEKPFLDWAPGQPDISVSITNIIYQGRIMAQNDLLSQLHQKYTLNS